jgi:hypothetical protein
MAASADPHKALGEMLREDRARGFTFDEVWDEDLAFAARHSAGWRSALEATRSAWEAAWSNMPGPGLRLSQALGDDTRDSAPTSLLLA